MDKLGRAQCEIAWKPIGLARRKLGLAQCIQNTKWATEWLTVGNNETIEQAGE